MTLNQVAISPVFPLWLIFLLLFFGLAAAVYQYWLIRRRLGSPRAAVLSLLRLGALFLLISFALNPSLWARKEQKVYSVPRHPLGYLSKHGSSRSCRKREQA